jgi:hypothetical protein
MLIYKLKGPNIKTSSKLKKPNEVGIHFVCLEMLNLNVYTILRSDELEDDT